MIPNSPILGFVVIVRFVSNAAVFYVFTFTVAPRQSLICLLVRLISVARSLVE